MLVLWTLGMAVRPKVWWIGGCLFQWTVQVYRCGEYGWRMMVVQQVFQKTGILEFNIYAPDQITIVGMSQALYFVVEHWLSPFKQKLSFLLMVKVGTMKMVWLHSAWLQLVWKYIICDPETSTKFKDIKMKDRNVQVVNIFSFLFE